MDLENNGHNQAAGTVAMLDALDLLDTFPQWTFEEAKAVAMMITNQDEKRHLLSLLSLAQAQGYMRPSSINNLEDRLRADISDSLQTAEKTGGETAVFTMIFNRKRQDRIWQVLADGTHILASNYKSGQLGWISGGLGTGKTASSLSVGEEWVDMGNTILSNVKLTESIEGYVYVPDAKALVLAVADLIETDPLSRWLFIMDEAPVSGYYKADATTSKDKTIDKFVFCLRKLGGNMLLIVQREHSVPTTIQELGSSRYYCHRVGGGVVTVDLEGPERWFHAKIQDFPLTSWSFLSEKITYFATTEVIDLDGLLRSLDDTDNVPKTIRNFAAKRGG